MKKTVKFFMAMSYVFLFFLSQEAQAQLYEWEESSMYIKPIFGLIVLGKTNAELRPIVDDSDTFEYVQDDGYGYFPSIVGIALERKLRRDVLIEIEGAFFQNYNRDELTSDKESHALVAVGPVYRYLNDSLITPVVSVSLGGIFSQYNSTDIVQDEIASVIDDATSFVGQAKVGVDLGFWEEIDFGIGYKFMFIGSQNDLEVFGIEPQTLYFGPKIGHRFEGSIRVGTNVF